MRRRVVTVVALGVTLVASSVASAWVNHERRQRFDQLTRLERERDALVAQWGRLSIERGTLGSHEVVLRKAREKLHLVHPTAERIVVVQP